MKIVYPQHQFNCGSAWRANLQLTLNLLLSYSYMLTPQANAIQYCILTVYIGPTFSAIRVLKNKMIIQNHVKFKTSASRWHGAPQPALSPMSRFELERIDLAITSLTANEPVASEPECARDQCQSELGCRSCLASPDI